MPRVRITFLGTSGSTPTVERNPISVLLEYQGRGYLFDVGEGTQRQFMRFRRSLVKVEHIFLSHFHGDHVFGLPGALHTMALLGRRTPLHIWAPDRQIHRVEALVRAIPFRFPFDVFFHGVSPGEEVVSARDFRVYTYALDHSVQTLAYVWEEHPRKRADKEKLKALGLYNNPLVRRLKEGEAVEWKGKIIRPEDVVYVVPGIKIVYAVDTRPVEADEARGADLLIHDGTFGPGEEDLAEEKKHSTVVEAAELAKRLNVKQLALVHISGRHRDVSPLLEAARAVFPNTIIPSDGDVLEI